jgi:hypothetical protein
VAVTDFDTKVAVIVRDDLAVWQRLNVVAFLMSGITATGEPGVVGPSYVDGAGVEYLPMLRQPVLVFEAAGAKLTTVARRAREREVPFALYTAELFSTGHDDDNRAAVAAVPTDELDLVGIGFRAPHRAADQLLRGLRRHP